MSRKTRIAHTKTIDLRPRRRRTDAGWQADLDQRQGEERLPRLAIVQPVAKTALTPGTVVWAHIPYEDTDGWKLRPVVVSHTAGRAVTVFPGTTTDKRHRYPRAYRELTELESAGLRRATGVELSPLTIDVIDVVTVAGELGVDDQLAVIGAGHAAPLLPHEATQSVAVPSARRTLEVVEQVGVPCAA